MPYTIKDEGVDKVDERYCVYKKGSGGAAEGKSLGCHASRADAEKQIAAIYANESKAMIEMRFRLGGAVKALPNRRLEVLACPFGSPQDLDKMDEYFSPNTEFMLEVGDKRPTLYFHGFTPNKQMEAKPAPIGKAVVSKVDDRGLWMEVELKPKGKAAQAQADRIWHAAEQGTCRASTGAVNYLCRSAPTGEVEVWPVGELSLIDEGLGRHPVNDKAVAMPLRASFEQLDLAIPEVFEAGEAMDTKERPANTEIKMDEIQAEVKRVLAEREAMRTQVVKELTTPAVMKEAVLGSDDKQQEHEFFWNMRHRNFERRTLDETQAAEGLGLMPIGLVNQIHEMASAQSFAQAAGMPVYQTNLSQVTIPREAATPILSDEVAEEGAISESVDPAFGAVTATVTKHVDYISVTEELLEDSTMLPAYFKRLAARKLALAENLDVVTAMRADTTDLGVALAVLNTLTKAELDAAVAALLPDFRPGAAWFMNDSVLQVIRALATMIAVPYNHWTYGTGINGDATVLGYPVYTDANWGAVNCAVTVHFMCFANVKLGLAKIENPNIGITVNPYLMKDTGFVRFYLGSRWCIWVTQPLVAFSSIIQHA